MNFDDDLRNAWLAEQDRPDTAKLTARIQRHRRRHGLMRTLEIVLTCGAIGVFGYAFASGSATAAHWLLLPFFAIYLPVAWIILLRKARLQDGHSSEAPQDYARIRMSQLRTNLRDLWLARRIALFLLGYAAVAAAVTFFFGDIEWREVAMVLLASALAWTGVTFLLSHRVRIRRLREYRSARRMLNR